MVQRQKARSKGVEASLTVSPSEWFSISTSAAYTDARYVSYTGAQQAVESTYLGPVQDLSDRRLPKVPKFAYTVALDAARPLGADHEASDLDVSAGGGDGVIVTQGGRFSGWGLVVLRGVPTFLYRTSDTPDSLTRVAAPSSLAPGRHKVEVRFTVESQGFGKGGTLALKVDGSQVASGHLADSMPINFTEADAAVGRDNGTPVTNDYRVPFPLAGLRSVTFDLGPLQRPRVDGKTN